MRIGGAGSAPSMRRIALSSAICAMEEACCPTVVRRAQSVREILCCRSRSPTCLRAPGRRLPATTSNGPNETVGGAGAVIAGPCRVRYCPVTLGRHFRRHRRPRRRPPVAFLRAGSLVARAWTRPLPASGPRLRCPGRRHHAHWVGRSSRNPFLGRCGDDPSAPALVMVSPSRAAGRSATSIDEGRWPGERTDSSVDFLPPEGCRVGSRSIVGEAAGQSTLSDPRPTVYGAMPCWRHGTTEQRGTVSCRS